MADFRLCSTSRSHSQAGLYHYAHEQNLSLSLPSHTKGASQTIGGMPLDSEHEPLVSYSKGVSSTKKSYTHPLLRYLSQQEGVHVLQEIHSGCCGAHAGTWILANKALRAGYFWPTMKQDVKQLGSKCEKCQRHASLIHQPAEPLTTMLSPCPFSQWGIDIVGPFPLALARENFC
ncbi:UNVERIFIED_CONTAM: hypothetical protein Sradi_0185700 [Sesamum radiatum]|uniref:Integrase zinc-binding domain-containing protein n=1 Tax=Sesamum radiatum TaxID=300843 RepID=A0AAW2W0B0_SESRA